jgi:hypothetical protein
VETALPWPRDVGELPHLAPVAERIQGLGVRLQALVPPDRAVEPEDYRVILHAHRDGTPFSSYRRFETTAGKSIGEAVERLVAAADTGAAGSEGGVDLLVCAHGRRDVCCGSLGTELALQLGAGESRPGTRLWRTSHTGGHRFAPTFIVLPQGTAWAFADRALVSRVLDRSVPFAEVAGHYRGCAGLAGPQPQTLEREVLRLVGWELLDRPRLGFVTGETVGDGGQIVRLEAGSDRWEGVVRPGRTLPVPDCMRPLSEAKKTETEWTVSEVRAVA